MTPAASLHGFLQQLRRCAGAESSGALSDAELLDRYLTQHDDSAFEVLVWRHGGMVLGVCRRILRGTQDIEDAFQATFLTLVRRASTISKREALGSWLYKVAYRIALAAQAQAAKRPASLDREIGVNGELEATQWRDLRPVIDEEINCLPVRYRAPFVLCYLEGKTTDEAARQLGWPRGTVATRLAGARKRLRMALTRRGITLGGGVLGASLAGSIEAQSLPPSWILAVMRVIRLTAGDPRSSGVSGAAKSLSDAVVHSMLLSSWKHPAQMVVVVALLAFVSLAVSSGWSLSASGPDAAISPLPEAPRAEEKPDEHVRSAVARARAYLLSLEQDGKWEQHYPQAASVNPGGLTSLVVLALLESGSKPADPPIAKALAYLRTVEPDATYVLGLQTAVFCRAEPKKDLARIQRNVDRLLAARCRDDRGRLRGWNYRGSAHVSDNSNTQFAILALDAADRVGAKMDKSVWEEIRNYYMRTQQADGGWVYNSDNPNGRSTFTMTCAGACGLLLAQQRLPDKKEGLAKALGRSLRFLGEHFRIDAEDYAFYALHGLSRAGRLAGKRTIRDRDNAPHDWYREGSDFLVREQAGDGSWRTPHLPSDDKGIVDTSFGLLFLAHGKTPLGGTP
jgi:RNA polymerase sigma factor (sigma-70 family)